MRRTARLKTHRLLGLVSLLISLLISGCVTTVITPPVAYKAALEPTTQNHSELKTRALDKKSRVNAASGKLQRTAKVPSGHGGKWGSACVGSWYINKEHDPATKWSYHGARWMAPQLGRWLTPDPPVKVPEPKFMYAPWDLNPYQYGRSNPVVFWDPDGRVNAHNFEMVKASPQVRNKEVTPEQQSTGIANAQGMADQVGDTAKSMMPSAESVAAASFGPVGMAVKSTADMSDNVGAMIDSYFEIKDIVNDWDTYSPEERAYYAGRIQGAVMANAALGVIFKNTFQRLNISTPHTSCFVGGTLVATEDGFKKIEDIEAGDVVWARDVASGEIVKAKVTSASERGVSTVVEIRLSNNSIQATEEHPFWVVGRGWVKVGQLEIGDQLLGINGDTYSISDLKSSKKEQTVYNIEVAEFHNYFAGLSSILVHNGCGPGAKVRKLREGGEVHVRTVKEARALLDKMPELKPATANRRIPTTKLSEGKDPRGTYRGDLINKKDPTGPVHPQVNNPAHRDNPHYNITLPDGNKAAIIIDVD